MFKMPLYSEDIKLLLIDFSKYPLKEKLINK